MIFNRASGIGKIIEVKPNEPYTLKLFENGKIQTENFIYHQVYTDGKYVYDPRLSLTPVPKSDWTKLIKKLNPKGVTIKKVNQ